jgi:hypothetical protein
MWGLAYFVILVTYLLCLLTGRRIKTTTNMTQFETSSGTTIEIRGLLTKSGDKLYFCARVFVMYKAFKVTTQAIYHSFCLNPTNRILK